MNDFELSANTPFYTVLIKSGISVLEFFLGFSIRNEVVMSVLDTFLNRQKAITVGVRIKTGMG